MCEGNKQMVVQWLKKLVKRPEREYLRSVSPHGISLLNDITRMMPGYQAKVIFDVGANVGQSANQYHSWPGSSDIYCFEPVASTFCQLEQNTAGLENVHCFRLALGASQGEARMLLEGPSPRYAILRCSEGGQRSEDLRTEKVRVDTLCQFCQMKGIAHIHFLKIDTEGYDLEVLKGSDKMLEDQQIDLVEVEAGMNPRNRTHVPLEQIKRYLEQRGYFLFGIYEQVHEWPTKAIYLRRANAVFISDRMVRLSSQIRTEQGRVSQLS
jgi:FkbM family methyltransferase